MRTDVTSCMGGRPDVGPQPGQFTVFLPQAVCLAWVGWSQLGMYSGHFIGHQLQGRSPGEKLLAQNWPALLGSHCLICSTSVRQKCLLHVSMVPFPQSEGTKLLLQDTSCSVALLSLRCASHRLATGGFSCLSSGKGRVYIAPCPQCGCLQGRGDLCHCISILREKDIFTDIKSFPSHVFWVPP